MFFNILIEFSFFGIRAVSQRIQILTNTFTRKTSTSSKYVSSTLIFERTITFIKKVDPPLKFEFILPPFYFEHNYSVPVSVTLFELNKCPTFLHLDRLLP